MLFYLIIICCRKLASTNLEAWSPCYQRQPQATLPQRCSEPPKKMASWIQLTETLRLALNEMKFLLPEAHPWLFLDTTGKKGF